MNTAALASSVPSFSDRIFSVLEKLDYKVAVDEESRDAVFRLRYDAYERENLVEPMFSRRLSDRFDDLDNTMIVSLHLDGRIAGTIRVSILTSDYPDGPDLSPFETAIRPMIDAGQIIIDPTRLAADASFSNTYPGLMPFLTTRVAWMAGEYFGADQILASVRVEHQAFYRRIFGCRVICEPRPYPPLTKPLSLMTLDFKAERDKVLRRYPAFRSTQFERRMLFEGGLPIPPLAPAIQPNTAEPRRAMTA